MKRQKKLQEAGTGSYKGLSSQEQIEIARLSPELRSTLANVVTTMRKRNPNIGLTTIAKQLLEVPQMAGNAELSKFIGSFDAQSTDPGRISAALQRPAGGVVGLPGNFPKPAPSPVGADVGRSSVPLPNNFFPAKQQASGGGKSFEGQLAARKARKEREAVGIMKTRPSLPESKRNLKEFAGTQMGASVNLQKILQSVSGLKPEEISSLKTMLDGLMSGGAMSARPGMAGSGMTTESKKLITEVMKRRISEQVAVRNRVVSILQEGPMDSIWSKLKSAGTAVGQKMGLMGQAGQAANDASQQETQVSQELMKMVAKVNQHRQKFNSSILKNSQTLDQYHNLVAALVDAYKQNQHSVGAAGPQISRQIQDAVGAFVYDLKSEKEQIDMFLKQLQSAGASKVVGGSSLLKRGDEATLDPAILGAAAKKKAQAARIEENPTAGVTSARRNAPGARLGPENLEVTKQAILDRAKSAKSPQDKKKAMNDLEQLFLRQISRDKREKQSKPAKKKKK